MPRDTMTTARAAALLLGSLALLACGNRAPDAQAGQEPATLPATPAAAADAAANGDAAPQDSPLVVVYKSPTCGCCAKWVEHMREAGFRLEVHDTADVSAIKAQHGVTRDLQSCHTALVDGYVLEGHVPAEVVRRFLAERPMFAGLAVPGMPMGAPGMEGPRKDRYDVVAFRRDGTREVYSSH
ncbi:MAG TPA: DUF411 domain-containing protein [Longimicrobiales bacterium]